MTQYLLKAVVLIVLGAIAVLMVFIAKYWAPDRTVAELKQWQLPNSEFIDIQGMQAHVVQSANCYKNRDNAAEKKPTRNNRFIAWYIGKFAYMGGLDQGAV
ncbi:hypothetical protein [Psychrobacter sp. JCM 18901]|uniref:hypothetical protein n=1 Tax=Psychrobacter sp. JCM 18901 TaxID=1298609 RepID=UPI0004B3A545|nr:hypothetical protein [Psychrobacter sp. JCM 18901]